VDNELWRKLAEARSKIAERAGEAEELLVLLEGVQRVAFEAERAIKDAAKNRPVFEILRLGQLIDLLPEGGTGHVVLDFPAVLTSSVDSYRGYYSDLALGYEFERAALGGARIEPPKAGELRKDLAHAVGGTFGGWKGGDFTMTRDTRVWVDNPGDCHSIAIVGADCDGPEHNVYVHTWRM